MHSLTLLLPLLHFNPHITSTFSGEAITPLPPILSPLFTPIPFHHIAFIFYPNYPSSPRPASTFDLYYSLYPLNPTPPPHLTPFTLPRLQPPHRNQSRSCYTMKNLAYLIPIMNAIIDEDVDTSGEGVSCRLIDM